ncbi:hypothetical protein [Streptomyces griseosporeus]|uniref:hypothetical protein n=1 Tax=Streptomyces griseosporeus TaxID=1910 RepID=UPI0036FDEB6B
MAEPINLGDQEDPEDRATEDRAHAPDGRTVPSWRNVQHPGGTRATSPKPGKELGSVTTVDPVSDKPDEEGPLESAFLPGAVTSVWSNILSTAFRRLQEGR